MSASRPPTTVQELAARLAGAAGPTSDDQSRTMDGEVLDSRESVERFLAMVEQIRTVVEA